MIKINDRFRSKETGQEFRLDRIVPKPKDKKAEPVLHFEYTNRPDAKGFTCYQEHVDRALYFGYWIKLEKQ